MEVCGRTGEEGSVRKRCLSTAKPCLCLQPGSHNTEALVCVCVCITLKSYITIRCSAGDTVQMNPRMPFYWI